MKEVSIWDASSFFSSFPFLDSQSGIAALRLCPFAISLN
jgi:hypothetical protein